MSPCGCQHRFVDHADGCAHCLCRNTCDDFVDAWHDGDEDGVPLHEYLGMTWGEYAAWVERPSRSQTT